MATPISGERIQFLDYLRGLLILLMSSSHALKLSEVARDSFFWSPYWLPRAWASQGFVIVSGVTAALVYDWDRAFVRATSRVRWRSWQLLVIMFLSNVVLRACSYAMGGDLSPMGVLSWWTGLLTLRTEYSLSGILLGTVVLLQLMPALAYLRRTCGTAILLALAAALLLTLHLVRTFAASGSTVQAMLAFGPSYPLLPLVVNGITGFAIGKACKERITNRSARSVPLYVSVLVFTPLVLPDQGAFVLQAFLPLSRIFVLAGVVAAALVVPGVSNAAKMMLGTLGKYSLFVFVGHRIAVQGAVVVGKHLLLRPVETYAAALCGSLLILLAACWYRSQHPVFDNACRHAWL